MMFLTSRTLLLLLVPHLSSVTAFTQKMGVIKASQPQHHLTTTKFQMKPPVPQTEDEHTVRSTSGDAKRRAFLSEFASIAAASMATVAFPLSSLASDRTTADATVTDKIFLEFKGMDNPNSPDAAPSANRIVIGLFGEDAPQPSFILKQLVSKNGYLTKCKAKPTGRLIQREQLEANKVYNACIENQDKYGVTYDRSTIWRISKDNRIDVGAIIGKFVARENPNFLDEGSGLRHDASGVVSVRRGEEGGFGFTIYPGGDADAARLLDEDNIVIGRVIEGMDVVAALNDFPVVKSSNLNYMGLTGTQSNASPSRACRYGGPMYCNELKPLRKIQVYRTGVL